MPALGRSFCAAIPSGAVGFDGVACWGIWGGTTQKAFGSLTPIAVFSGVAVTSISGTDAKGDGTGYGSYCAVLTSSNVYCWGDDNLDQLGIGGGGVGACVQCSEYAVGVDAVGGSGLLTGVAHISTDFLGSFCATLTSGGVDCWGFNASGEVGDGAVDGTLSSQSVGTPVAVKGVGGIGTLSGVASVTNYGEDVGFPVGSYCAVLNSGGVDCWGANNTGEMGNGTQSPSQDIPVVVSEAAAS